MTGNSPGEINQHRRPPYWKRAHKDWRVWVAVIAMIAGMMIYVMSDDFALRPRSRPPDRLSDTHP